MRLRGILKMELLELRCSRSASTTRYRSGAVPSFEASASHLSVKGFSGSSHRPPTFYSLRGATFDGDSTMGAGNDRFPLTGGTSGRSVNTLRNTDRETLCCSNERRLALRGSDDREAGTRNRHTGLSLFQIQIPRVATIEKDHPQALPFSGPDPVRSASSRRWCHCAPISKPCSRWW